MAFGEGYPHITPGAFGSLLPTRRLIPGDVFEIQITYGQRRDGRRSPGRLLPTPQGPEIHVSLGQDVLRQPPMARPFCGQIKSPGSTPLHNLVTAQGLRH